MQDGSVPPIEWVPAGGRWWFFRIVIPAMAVGVILLTVILEWFVFGPPTGTSTSWAYFDGVILGALAVEFVFLFAFPSVRRIGISPKGLVVDIGLRRLSYSWPEVNQITRTQVRRYRWNRVSSVSRTRISVGSGLSQTIVTLSPNQGERLAQFLRIT